MTTDLRAKFKVTRRQFVALATLSVVATIAQVSSGQFSNSRPFPAPAPHGYQQHAQRVDRATSPTQLQVPGNIQGGAGRYGSPGNQYNEPSGAGPRRRHQSAGRLVSKVKDKLSGKARDRSMEPEQQAAERGRLSNFGSRIKNKVHGFSSKMKHSKQHGRNSAEPTQGFYLLNNHGPVTYDSPPSFPVSHNLAPPANGPQLRQPVAQYLPQPRQEAHHSVKQHRSRHFNGLSPAQIATNQRVPWPSEVADLAEQQQVAPRVVPQMIPSEFNAQNQPILDAAQRVSHAKDHLSFHNQIQTHSGPLESHHNRAFNQMPAQYPSNFQDSILSPEAAHQVYAGPSVSNIPREYVQHNQPPMDTAPAGPRGGQHDQASRHADETANRLNRFAGSELPIDAQIVSENHAPDRPFQPRLDQYHREETGHPAGLYANNEPGGLSEPLNDRSTLDPLHQEDKFAARPQNVDLSDRAPGPEFEPTHAHQHPVEHHSSGSLKLKDQQLDHNKLEHQQPKHQRDETGTQKLGHHGNGSDQSENLLPGRKLPKHQADHHPTENQQVEVVPHEQHVDQQRDHRQPGDSQPVLRVPDSQFEAHKSGHRLPKHHQDGLHQTVHQHRETPQPGHYQPGRHLPKHSETNPNQSSDSPPELLKPEHSESEQQQQSEVQQPSVHDQIEQSTPELPHSGNKQSSNPQHGYRLPRGDNHSDTHGQHQVEDKQPEHLQNGPHQNGRNEPDVQQPSHQQPKLQQHEQQDALDQSEHYQANNQLPERQAKLSPLEHQQHEHRQPEHNHHQPDNHRPGYDQPDHVQAELQHPKNYYREHTLPAHDNQMDLNQSDQQQPGQQQPESDQFAQHQHQQLPEYNQHDQLQTEHNQPESVILPEQESHANHQPEHPVEDPPNQPLPEQHQPAHQTNENNQPEHQQSEQTDPAHAGSEHHHDAPREHLPHTDHGPGESLSEPHHDHPDRLPVDVHQPLDGPMHQDELVNGNDFTHLPHGNADLEHEHRDNEADQTDENTGLIPIEFDQVAPNVPSQHSDPVHYEQDAGSLPGPSVPMHNLVDGNTILAPLDPIVHDQPFDVDHADNFHLNDLFDQHLETQDGVMPLEQLPSDDGYHGPVDSSIDALPVDSPEMQHTNNLIHADDSLYANHNTDNDKPDDLPVDNYNTNLPDLPELPELPELPDLPAPSVEDFINNHRTGESIIEYDSGRKLESELIARLPPKEAKPKCIGENCKIFKRKAIKLPKMFFNNMLSSVSNVLQGKTNQNPPGGDTNELINPVPGTPLPEGAEAAKPAPESDETQIEDKSNTSDLSRQNLHKIKPQEETKGNHSKRPMWFSMRGVKLRRTVPMRLGRRK